MCEGGRPPGILHLDKARTDPRFVFKIDLLPKSFPFNQLAHIKVAPVKHDYFFKGLSALQSWRNGAHIFSVHQLHNGLFNMR